MLTVIALLPVVAEWGFALAAGVLSFGRSRHAPELNVRAMKRLLVVGVVVLFALALLATVLQYAAWRGDPFSRNLLPPHQSILYFAKYAGTHFWLAPMLSLIVSAAFYGFLLILKRKNERFFEEGEVELGAIAALLAGWPRVIVFLPLAFLAVIIISGIKMALRKGAYTTLGLPFLLGLVVTLAYGYVVLEALGLSSLAVIPGLR